MNKKINISKFKIGQLVRIEQRVFDDRETVDFTVGYIIKIIDSLSGKKIILSQHKNVKTMFSGKTTIDIRDIYEVKLLK